MKKIVLPRAARITSGFLRSALPSRAVKDSTMRFLFANLALIAFGNTAAFAAGALAIDGNKGDAYGWAINYETLDQARARALEECGEECRLVLTFNGGGAAYVADQAEGSTVYAWARAETSAEARNLAMQKARELGATEPVARVWGEESKHSDELETKLDEEKVKVAVRVLMSTKDKVGEYNEQVTGVYFGWTNITTSEYMRYGLDDAVDAFDPEGMRITSLQVFGMHNRENSPVIERFVENAISNHKLYSRRADDPEYFKGIQTSYGDSGFAYEDAGIVLLTEDTPYTAFYEAFSERYRDENYSRSHRVINLGEF